MGSSSKLTENRRAELLQNVVLSIAASSNWIQTDLLALVEHVHEELGKIIEACDLYVGLENDNKDLVDLYFSYGEKGKSSEYKQRSYSNGMTEYVIKKGKGLLLTKGEIETLIQEKGIEHVSRVPTSWILVPLKSEGHTVGVIAVRCFKEELTYTEEDFQAVKFVATQVSNVVERQLIQQELMRSEDYYRSITENATDVVLILDEQGSITYSSQSTETILGINLMNFWAKT